MNRSSKKKKTTIFYLVCVALVLPAFMLVVSCAGSRSKLKRPKIKIHSLRLAKAVERMGDNGVPVNPTSIYSNEDKQVVALLKIDNISGSYHMRWDWYRPDRKLHCSSGNMPVTISKEKFVRTMTAWHALDLEADRASKYTGQWFVKFYINNELVDSKAFDLQPYHLDKQSSQTGVKNAESTANNWGFVIGIQRYPNLQEVKYVHEDIANVKNWFGATLGIPEDHVVTLMDKDATKIRIRSIINYFLAENVRPDTVLYIYYAGHGMVNPKSKKPFLVPYDANPALIGTTGYSLKELVQDTETLKMRSAFIFLDTSFNNKAGRSSEMLVAPKGKKRPAKKFKNLPLLVMSDRIAVMGAASGNQVNFASEEKKAGLFTFYLTRSMDKALRPNLTQTVTIEDVYSYVAGNIKSDTKSGVQTPWLSPDLKKIGKLTLREKRD